MSRAWELTEPLPRDVDPTPLARCLKVLGSPAQLRVLRALLHSPLRRSQLTEIFGWDASRALKALEQAGFIERVWHQGSRIEWRAVDGALEHIAAMLVAREDEGPGSQSSDS